MSLFSKVITVSEIEEASAEIGKLFSESAAYTGLIEDTVEDLKLSNAKVLEERNNELERRDAILEEEVRKLKQQLCSIMDNVCFDKTCHNRKESITNSKNGTKSKKKV